MSVAWYIVLRTDVPGFDPFVNGKHLPRASKILDDLAKQSGVRSLADFFSAKPEDLAAFAGDLGVEPAEAPLALLSEKWFSAQEGLRTIEVLKLAVREFSVDGAVDIACDLTEFERVLRIASENDIEWHLAVDF